MAGNGKKDKETTQSGVRPEWKAKQQRKQIAGILKAVIGVVILGVLVGLGIVFKDQITAFFAKKEEPKVTAPPPAPPPPIAKAPDKVEAPPPLTKAVPPPVQEKPPEVKPPEVVPTGEEEIAKKLMADGRTAMEAFDFDKAINLYKEAGAKKCGAALKSEAKTWEHKATQFKLATKHIPISDFAKAEESYIVKMHDGNEWVGLKLKEDDNFFHIQAINRHNPAADGRQRTQLPKMEIKEAVPVSLKQRQQEFMELLGALEAGVNAQSSADYYDLVYLSKRLMLGKQCIAYLDRAYSGGSGRNPDPKIGDTMRKEVIRRAIDKASLMLTSGRPRHYVEKELEDLKRKLPDYQVAADEVDAFKLFAAQNMKDDFKTTMKVKEKKAPEVAAKPEKGKPPAVSARELVAEDVIEVVIEEGGVKGRNAGSAALVDQANAKYKEAMATFTQFKSGTNGNNNQVLKSALVAFEACIDLYEKALDKDPGNKDIENRMQEASMNCYSCRKYQTL
ncbi:MAG TPA: hypothetical protein VEJ63_02955 [Planctomycetota bacterium]|nr:hypothetical protein [Planctomycetota bacterium]